MNITWYFLFLLYLFFDSGSRLVQHLGHSAKDGEIPLLGLKVDTGRHSNVRFGFA